jgi:hypothetical protein
LSYGPTHRDIDIAVDRFPALVGWNEGRLLNRQNTSLIKTPVVGRPAQLYRGRDSVLAHQRVNRAISVDMT